MTDITRYTQTLENLNKWLTSMDCNQCDFQDKCTLYKSPESECVKKHKDLTIAIEALKTLITLSESKD